jgi:serine/threonine protein kinase/tetratricopeptide (TPR) repeat protein
MVCPRCQTETPLTTGRCIACSAELSVALGSMVTGAVTPGPSPSASASADETRLAPSGLSGGFSPGTVFAGRYQIEKMLGAGGMGAVYKAQDLELGIPIALKVIRSEVLSTPGVGVDFERRFKQELLLARQVTHQNVLRIHDLGEANGVKYITMPFIEGSDLHAILLAGRVPFERVLALARQMTSGLAAAHEVGIVHRDLKPQNILVDTAGRAYISDFGLAKSYEASAAGLTRPGDFIGTPRYMAPESVEGQPTDHRSDLYALGLILYEMASGSTPFPGESALEVLMQRVRISPRPLKELAPELPPYFTNIVMRCLQKNPTHRYQSARELLHDLDQAKASAGPRAGQPSVVINVPLPTSRRGWIAAALVAVVLVGAIFAVPAVRSRFSRGTTTTTTSPGPTTVKLIAILPFRNASGDPTLDSVGASMSQVLNTMLGQSAHIRPVPSNRIDQLLRDLQIAPNATLAPAQFTSVADFTGARNVLWGSVTRFGNAIRIDAILQDLDGQEAVPLNAMAPSEGALLTAISELADVVRQQLARGSSDALAQLKSTSWKPSTNSFDALRSYNDGVRLMQQGSHQAALKRFEAATKEDANFALSYSGLAQAYSALGYDDEAARASRQAMALSDRLPLQEKQRIAATHYRLTNVPEKAIESYEILVKASPEDAIVRFDLGTLYEQSGALDQAKVHFAKVVELDPKFIEGLLALGRVEIKLGDFQTSLEPLGKALTLATQLQNDEARANILQAIGIAYMRLNRPNEALRQYQDSLEIKQRLGNKRGMAASYVQIGEVEKTLGNPEEAEKSYKAALKLGREIGDKAGMSATLIDLAALLEETFGRPAEALPYLQEALTITRDTGNRNLEARALGNMGALYLAQGQYSDAQTYLERALEIRDTAQAPQETADILHNLGETLTRIGRYDQALQRYIRALELRRSAGDRRSATLDSYGIGLIFDYQGRYGAAVKSKAEALQALRDLKERDAWLGEILSGYAHSLTLSGHIADAEPPLNEALTVGRELKNANLIAQGTRFQAERLYLSGDLKRAAELAQQAVQAGQSASDRSLALLAQAQQVVIASSLQPARPLASRLEQLAQEAERRGATSLAVECAVQRTDVLHRLGDGGTALQESERAIVRAEALGLKVTLAKAHYVKATILRARGDAAARREYAATLRLLEEVKRDEGNEKVLERGDLAGIYAESTKWSKDS